MSRFFTEVWSGPSELSPGSGLGILSLEGPYEKVDIGSSSFALDPKALSGFQVGALGFRVAGPVLRHPNIFNHPRRPTALRSKTQSKNV